MLSTVHSIMVKDILEHDSSLEVMNTHLCSQGASKTRYNVYFRCTNSFALVMRFTLSTCLIIKALISFSSRLVNCWIKRSTRLRLYHVL